jgi:hypothetical protein
MNFIARVILGIVCFVTAAPTNQKEIAYVIPKDGKVDIIVSNGNIRKVTFDNTTPSILENDSGILCENNSKFTKVWGTYQWIQRKKITNDHSTLHFPWEQTVGWEITTSRSEMTGFAREQSDTASMSIGVEISGDFFFGSAKGTTEFSYASSLLTKAVRESTDTTTVTKSESETFRLDIPPNITVYIYEGILKFPGKDFSTTELRLTDKPLPNIEQVFMKIPVKIAGEHQGCACGVDFQNRNCPNANECCSKVLVVYFRMEIAD